jgi:enoyl-CoA hydratase
MFDVTIEGETISISMNRAPVNAINEEWIDRLGQLLDSYEVREEIRVLRFRSALKAFCGGADIDMLAERLSTPTGIDKMIRTVRRMQALYSRIEQSPLVSIAEINGAALGGGFELALACDIRVASETAKIGLPEARHGLLPGAGGTQRLTKLFGAALSRRLILGTEVLDGAEAARLGLVHWAFPPDQLATRTDEIVRRLETVPKGTIRANKRCIFAAQERQSDGFELEVQMTKLLYESPESLNRLQSFLARRKP